jgi:lipoprotein-releasing system permease protein
MYVWLLCRKYLTTRWIALASVVSVMLGVATMIVVNGVMEGFRTEMQARIHAVLSDVVVEGQGLEGFEDPERHMNEIRRVAGEYIEGMTPTVVVPAMLSFKVQRQWITQPVQLIGIDEKSQASAGEFAKFLQNRKNREQPSFQLREEGFDSSGGRIDLEGAGWPHRRDAAAYRKYDPNEQNDHPLGIAAASGPRVAGAVPTPTASALAGPTIGTPAVAAPAGPIAAGSPPAGPIPPPAAGGDPFATHRPTQNAFDPAKQQNTGVILGIGLTSFRNRDGDEQFLAIPGDDVRLTFPTSGTPPRPIDDLFTIVDFYECKMSEYDSTFVFVPIEKLQQLRGMIEPKTGVSRVTSIQLKLKNESDGDVVRDKLRAAFSPGLYRISTWRDKQGPLLAAVQMETAILNVLLFLIIAVAGFGILAIFFMIVVEKTKDIGVLKSLGASAKGVMGIFLGYGLSLGTVGAGGGLVLGLLMVRYINEIAEVLGMITGQKVFDPSIYYFQKIPTIVEPLTVTWVVGGAMVIAVAASVFPAMRAARLKPVEALRYD